MSLISSAPHTTVLQHPNPEDNQGSGHTHRHQDAKHDQPRDKEEEIDGEEPKVVAQGRHEEDGVDDGHGGDDGRVHEPRVGIVDAGIIDEIEGTAEEAEHDGAAC